MSTWHHTRMTRFILAGAVAACCIVPAHAGQTPEKTMAGLRTTLHALDSTQAIDGILTVKADTTEGKGDSTKKHTTSLSVRIHADDGLGLEVSPGLLHKVAAEENAHAADAGKATPTADLLGQIQVQSIQSMVSVAPRLLRMLARAQSPTLEQTSLDGKPVTLLSVTLPKPKASEDAPELKDYTSTARFWLGPDGAPLAYAYAFSGKFCKFLLCMSISRDESGALRTMLDRLVAVKWVKDSKQSGLGQDFSSHTTYTLQARATGGVAASP